jgi:hypothetical protein
MIASCYLEPLFIKNHQKEIGWWPIGPNQIQKKNQWYFFSFHGETFDLPTEHLF